MFPAGSKRAVLEMARRHDFRQRRAIFLIDGDFEWVRGEPTPAVHGVYRLQAYCIENLLIHEKPAMQITIEEANLPEVAAKSALGFDAWLREVSHALVPLFVSLTALNSVSPAEATIGLGVGSILTTRKRGRSPELDPAKIGALKETVDRKVASLVGEVRAEEIRTSLNKRVSDLPEPVRIVSGKDFLLPLFEFRLGACNVRCLRAALRIRMARHSDTLRFAELTQAIERAANE